MQVIGIDIGSSSIKGAVLDLERRTIEGVVQAPFCPPVKGLPPLHFEIDPAAIVGQFELVARQLLEAAPRCQALFCCAQMGGVILADDQGNARSNYISWQDQRVLGNAGPAGSHQDGLRARLGDDLIRRMGNEFRPGGAINLLSWLGEHRQIPGGGMTAMGIGDYVMMKVCRSSPMAHPTAALGTLDLTKREFCYEALEVLGLAGVRWPKLVDLSRPIGTWNFGGKELSCYAAVGDHQCALAGAGLALGELSVNISTGSQVSVRTAELRLGANYQSRPYFENGWLNTITHLPAGRALNAIVDLLTELSPTPDARGAAWERIQLAVKATPETDLAVSIAFFAGPAGDRGAFSNISLQNLTVGHLFRAAITSMADNYRNAADALAAGSEWNTLAFSGGLAQKLATLAEVVASRLGLRYRIAVSTEETLQGLLELGRATLG